MLKRMTALCLALTMMLSCMTIVSAEEETGTGTKITDSVTRTTNPTTENQVTSGDTAINGEMAGPSISSSATYYLTSDVTLTSSLQISGSSTVVNLYLNGYSLSVKEGVDTSVIRVNSSGAVLNIYDSTDAKYT